MGRARLAELSTREQGYAYQRKYHQVYNAKHRERRIAQKRLYSLKCRIGALIVLGGKCAVCGYNQNVKALQIDHIIPMNNHRAHKYTSTREFYLAVIGGERSNLQILCANCHAIKTYEDTKNRLIS